MVLQVSNPVFQLRMTGSLQNVLTDGSTTQVSQPSLNHKPTLTSGFGAGQINRVWESKSRVLAADDQEIFDLYDMVGIDIGGGAGRDALGQTVAYEEIAAIAIINENSVSSTGTLEVTPSSSEGWTPIGSHTNANGGEISAQGCLVKAGFGEVGYDVPSDGNSRITVKALNAAVTYSIHIFARNDDGESSSSSSDSSSSSSLSASSSSLSASSSSQSSSSSSLSSESSSSLSSQS